MTVGFVLTYLLARRIVEPVEQLDRAAAEVARQNYAIEVPVRSEDELGRLARTFNTMCASIRQAREDLIRQERISTIGRLSGSIVHDLRNPLAAIYGGAEMLVDADLPPAHVKRLAGNHLSRVAAHAGTPAGPAQRLARQGKRAGDVPPARSGVGGLRTSGRRGGPAGRDAGAGDSRRRSKSRWSAAAWSASSPT